MVLQPVYSLINRAVGDLCIISPTVRERTYRGQLALIRFLRTPAGDAYIPRCLSIIRCRGSRMGRRALNTRADGGIA